MSELVDDVFAIALPRPPATSADSCRRTCNAQSFTTLLARIHTSKIAATFPTASLGAGAALPKSHRNYLLASGVALILGALLHIAAIFGGPDWYAFLGAPAGLVALAGTDSLRPAISCVVIALMLFAFAAYAFSGAGVIRRLPALRASLALIGLGLIARGLLFVPIAAFRPHLLSGLCGKCAEPGLFLLATSALCLLVGGGYAVGAMQMRASQEAPPE